MHTYGKNQNVIFMTTWSEIGFDISYDFKIKTLWLQFLFWHLLLILS